MIGTNDTDRLIRFFFFFFQQHRVPIIRTLHHNTHCVYTTTHAIGIPGISRMTFAFHRVSIIHQTVTGGYINDIMMIVRPTKIIIKKKKSSLTPIYILYFLWNYGYVFFFVCVS